MTNSSSFLQELNGELLESLLMQAPPVLSTQFNQLDKETKGHCLRCANDFYKLGIDSIPWLQGALFHDIGKTLVPTDILLKSKTLTEDEWIQIKGHAINSQHFFCELNKHDPTIKPIYQMAVYHHERWNGSGYPFGMKGKEIPITARLLSIIDSFDAICSKRCYKASSTPETAFQILKKENGTTFDPILTSFVLKSLAA